MTGNRILLKQLGAKDLPVHRLMLAIDSAIADAKDQHFCAVADYLLGARTQLQKDARERLGIETERACGP